MNPLFPLLSLAVAFALGLTGGCDRPGPRGPGPVAEREDTASPEESVDPTPAPTLKPSTKRLPVPKPRVTPTPATPAPATPTSIAPTPATPAPATPPPGTPPWALRVVVLPTGDNRAADESACDAVAVSQHEVVAAKACVDALTKHPARPLAVQGNDVTVGQVQERLTARPSPRPRSTETGLVWLRVNFTQEAPIAPVATQEDIRKHHVRWLGAGGGRLLSTVSRKGGGEPLGYLGASSAREILALDFQEKAHEGALIQVHTGKDEGEGAVAVGFLTARLFDESQRRAHGIPSVPWIVEIP